MDIYNEVLAMLETIYVSDENNPSNTFNGTLGNVPVSTYADSNFIVSIIESLYSSSFWMILKLYLFHHHI